MSRHRGGKYVPYSVTKSRLANCDDGSWPHFTLAPTVYGQEAELLVGTPSDEIQNAIVGYIQNELSRPTMQSFFFHTNRADTIVIEPNPRYCSVRGKGIIKLYAAAAHLYCDGYTRVAEYSHPDFFTHLEQFINFLPTRLANEPHRHRHC
jgi:hypothetical protein